MFQLSSMALRRGTSKTQAIFVFFFLLHFALSAQTKVGLIAHYPFDDSFSDATGNTANNGIPVGAPGLGACGVSNNALILNGANDQIQFLGSVNNEFDTEDFTVSMYFKPIGKNGTQYLLSKRDMDCFPENSFYIRYVPARQTINAVLFESAERNVSLVHVIEQPACWQHVTLTRDAGKVRLYINGSFVQELGTTRRVNIKNAENLVLGNSPCRTANETGFDGLIDDFRVYNRALKDDEIKALYFNPDKIATRDTIIYLGNTVPIELTTTCATDFSWSPATGVLRSGDPEPFITPVSGGRQVYVLTLKDEVSSCQSTDSLVITVVDPAQLDCRELFLPKAFTPNGDGLNEIYKISNPFVVQDLIAFEIFDRWGSRVFVSTDPFLGWDGSVNGVLTNSGVFLYKVRYRCNGEEVLTTGSFTLMR